MAERLRARRLLENGEDGISVAILGTLEKHVPLDRGCVEFGAWDCTRLSNSRNPVESPGYAAVRIEPDAKRLSDLERLYRAHDTAPPFGCGSGSKRVTVSTPC